MDEKFVADAAHAVLVLCHAFDYTFSPLPSPNTTLGTNCINGKAMAMYTKLTSSNIHNISMMMLERWWNWEHCEQARDNRKKAAELLLSLLCASHSDTRRRCSSEIHSLKQAIDDVDWQIKFILMIWGKWESVSEANEIENEILGHSFSQCATVGGVLIYFMLITWRPDFRRTNFMLTISYDIEASQMWGERGNFDFVRSLLWTSNIFYSIFLFELCSRCFLCKLFRVVSITQLRT